MMPRRTMPTHMNWLEASKMRLMTVFQPANAVICAAMKNMDMKAIAVKYNELCRKFVQKRVWYSSSFRNTSTRQSTPSTMPPRRTLLVLLSNLNCVLVRFISQNQV